MVRSVRCLTIAILLCGMFAGCQDRGHKTPGSTPQRLVLQLNWYHDPSFSGEYIAAESNALPEILINEGRPNLSPLNEVVIGRSQFAIMGADIFLKALDASLPNSLPVSCIFVDFQRNPVGWILHPDVAAALGLTTDVANDPKARNEWAFQQIRSGRLKVGDKRGTETTSVWIQWAMIHHVITNVLPVGFDSSVVLSAPRLLYPVYLNEEPFKISEKIGRSVVVFDPADDGVALYGNIIVVSQSFAEKNPERIKDVRNRIKDGWEFVRDNRSAAAVRVSRYYTAVNLKTLESEIAKTAEFVFYNNSVAGGSELARWDKTLGALKAARIVSQRLTIDDVKQHLLE